MPPPVAQTPGTWLRGGGAGMFDAACRAAMIACGINPDDFGTYDQRAEAQSQARKEFSEREIARRGGEGVPHPSPCRYGSSDTARTCTCYQTAEALEREGGQNWLYLNSQSGHLSRNSFYQGTGLREDPCSNIRPSRSADGTLNAGTYGYRDNDALCMDHAGLRTGQEHYWVCRTEQAHAQSMGSNAPVPMSELERGVEMSARVVVDRSATSQGHPPDGEIPVRAGGTVATREARGALTDQAREEVREELQAREAAQGAADTVADSDAGTPNAPSSGGASQADKDKAVECIKDAWKKSIKEMQATAVAEHSTAAAAERDEVAAWNQANPTRQVSSVDEMPEPHRGAARGRVDERVAARQQELEGIGAESAGQAGDPHPTHEECLEYQANWLRQHQREDGSFPPMQGSTGTGPPPATTDGGGEMGGENL